MSPAARTYLLYLEDMLLSMQRIEEYVEGLDFVSFKKKYIIVDAVIRNFEIIGEASGKIPAHVKDKYPEIPWRKMYGLRNLLSHEYFGIDYEMVWEIIRKSLPLNREELERVIQNEKSPLSE